MYSQAAALCTLALTPQVSDLKAYNSNDVSAFLQPTADKYSATTPLDKLKHIDWKTFTRQYMRR